MFRRLLGAPVHADDDDDDDDGAAAPAPAPTASTTTANSSRKAVVFSWEHRAQMATRGYDASLLLDAAVAAGFRVRWVCPRPPPASLPHGGTQQRQAADGGGGDDDVDNEQLLCERLGILQQVTSPDFRMVVMDLVGADATTVVGEAAPVRAPAMPVIGAWPACASVSVSGGAEAAAAATAGGASSGSGGVGGSSSGGGGGGGPASFGNGGAGVHQSLYANYRGFSGRSTVVSALELAALHPGVGSFDDLD
jgi:hypothetical protein